MPLIIPAGDCARAITTDDKTIVRSQTKKNTRSRKPPSEVSKISSHSEGLCECSWILSQPALVSSAGQRERWKVNRGGVPPIGHGLAEEQGTLAHRMADSRWCCRPGYGSAETDRGGRPEAGCTFPRPRVLHRPSLLESRRRAFPPGSEIPKGLVFEQSDVKLRRALDPLDALQHPNSNKEQDAGERLNF